MRVADKIWQILKDYTDCVFMLPGGGAMHLVDALGRSGLPYTAMLHEQGAALAACGYAGISGRLGVCLVTSGPGATNAITGCATAWTDSFPVLFISGQTASDQFNQNVRTSGVQSVNIVPMVKPITKRAYQLIFGNHMMCGDVRDDIHELAELCMEGRPGPAWLDIPVDRQGEVVENDL
jgi:acetolactate synthase-1/2/3 large subunit